MSEQWKGDRSGVYRIRNLADGKLYLGTTTRLKARRYRHFYDLQRGAHRNRHLQSAYNKDGAAMFAFEVLAYVPPEDLRTIEQTLLDVFWDNGARCYNQARDASAPTRGRVMSDDHRRKLSEAQRGKPGRRWDKATRKTRRPITDATRAKMKTSGSLHNAKQHASVVSPDGTIREIFNLARFARDNGLSQSNLRAVLREERASHFGWRKAP